MSASKWYEETCSRCAYVDKFDYIGFAHCEKANRDICRRTFKCKLFKHK